MNKNNNLGRLLILLLITTIVCLAMYKLPNELFGFKLRKVDLLADIRVKTGTTLLDSLRIQLVLADSLAAESVVAVKDSASLLGHVDSVAVALRDSLYKVMQSSWKNGDSSGVRIEDFSASHTGLCRFFSAINQRESLGRPVRIAFLGDSFIEGDIIVADLRAGLQKRFGGRGVGFVPIASNVAQFRPTIEHQFSGWTTYSILTEKSHHYTLSGMTFQAKENALVHYKTVNRYANLQPVSTVKLLYEQNQSTRMQLIYNAVDTVIHTLPATDTVTQYVLNGSFTEASFLFTQTDGFHALGVAFEDSTGMVVDNYSLRGNSGMNLQQLNREKSEQLNHIRPYDLIILQYGLNVVTDSILQYDWYGKRMKQVVEYLKSCFPHTDILLLGVSDRSRQEAGEFVTMPAVLSLLNTQRKIARETEIPFWNTFTAMGGENSMTRYVKNNWASKDYTHLSFRGGREIAMSLLKAILLEKEFYDKAEKKTW